MERIEDKSKALSYIGLEIADALKEIPVPETKEVVKEAVNQIQEAPTVEETEYIEETQFEVEPKKSLWQRFKESKVGRAMSLVFRIRIVIDNTNSLPEGRGE